MQWFWFDPTTKKGRPRKNSVHIENSCLIEPFQKFIEGGCYA